MRPAILLIFCLSCQGQVLSAPPNPTPAPASTPHKTAASVCGAAAPPCDVLVSAQPILSYARHRIWTIQIQNNGLTPVMLSRESILQALPMIAALPNDLAQDILNGAAASNAHTWVQQLGNILLPAGEAAAAGTAIETKKNGPVYIAAGVAAISLGIQVFGSRAPNPSKYYNEMLPVGTVTIGSGAGVTYGVVTSISKTDTAQGPVPVSK